MPPRRAHVPDPPESMDFDFFPYNSGDADVYRRREGPRLEGQRRWEAWVHVRPAQHGRGLFAGRDFRRGEIVGRYVGFIVGRVGSAQVDYVSRTVRGDAITNVDGFSIDGRRPVQSNHVQLRDFGQVVLPQPQWKWPGAYVHMANDPRDSGRRANARLDPMGFMKTTRRVNEGEELLWNYGARYWKETKMLGTRKLPLYV